MKAYRYSRVSGLKQASDGHGLERQDDMISAWFKRHPEVEIDTEFTFKDAGKSAFKGKHIEKGASLALFLNAVESGLIETPCYLILEALDRLTRLPPIEARDRIVHPLLNKGVTIVTVGDGNEYSLESVNNSATGKSIMLEVFLGNAYTYSKTLSNRVQRAKTKQRIEAAESKTIFTAMCPFWLRVVEDKSGKKVFEPIPEAVDVVQRVFRDRVEQQLSLFKIASELNAEGIPLFTHVQSRKGKPLWTSASLSTLLKNESVTGLLRESQHLDSNGNPKYPAVPGYYPQVIDFMTFEKAQLLSRQGKAPSKREFAAATNIFRGYIRCHHCQKLCTINGVRPDFSGSITCRSSRDGLCSCNGVKTPTYSMKKFEVAVLDCLFRELSKVDTNQGVTANISALQQELRVLEQSRVNFETAIEEAELPSVVTMFVKKLEGVAVKIGAVEKQIQELSRTVEVKGKFTLDGLDRTRKEDREKMRDIISDYVKDIVIDLHQKTIDVFLRNGNGVAGFSLENPSEMNVEQLMRMVRGRFSDDVEFVLNS